MDLKKKKKLLFVLFVILSQVQAPVAVQNEVPKNKTECFGVFCLTYDLKAVSSFKFCVFLC